MRQRRLLVAAVVPAVVAAVWLPAIALAQTWTDFSVGGLTRKALVYVPSGIQEPPLLISLHGMGIGAGWHQGGMMMFEPIADREKFIVVYPEADQDLRWDLGGTHDIEFIEAIIEAMSAQYDVDRNRVYASGFSMGGMFSYTLACKLPDKIAAIAPGDGYPLGGGLFGCTPGRPVPIFHMHGTADDFVAYSGIHQFLGGRIAEYGCPTTPERTQPYPTTNPASMSFKERWGPCTNAQGQTSEVVLVSVEGMIHDWATAGKANANEDPAFSGKPFDIDGSEEAWAFLKTHSLDQPIPGAIDPGSEMDPSIAGGEQSPGGDGAIDAGMASPPAATPPPGDPATGGSAGAMATPPAAASQPQPATPLPTGPVVPVGGASEPGAESSGGCSVGMRDAGMPDGPRGQPAALLLLAVVALGLGNRTRRRAR